MRVDQSCCALYGATKCSCKDRPCSTSTSMQPQKAKAFAFDHTTKVLCCQHSSVMKCGGTNPSIKLSQPNRLRLKLSYRRPQTGPHVSTTLYQESVGKSLWDPMHQAQVWRHADSGVFSDAEAAFCEPTPGRRRAQQKNAGHNDHQVGQSIKKILAVQSTVQSTRHVLLSEHSLLLAKPQASTVLRNFTPLPRQQS